mgnify:CR=1 FL=1
MTGGPSQIDTWDPKPDRPPENRGPFASIATRIPGVRVCEHLPRQAAILDRVTLIRSVDARGSNHEPPKSRLRPRRAKIWLKRAVRSATTRSQPSARLQPAPTATPRTLLIEDECEIEVMECMSMKIKMIFLIL